MTPTGGSLLSSAHGNKPIIDHAPGELALPVDEQKPSVADNPVVGDEIVRLVG